MYSDYSDRKVEDADYVEVVGDESALATSDPASGENTSIVSCQEREGDSLNSQDMQEDLRELVSGAVQTAQMGMDTIREVSGLYSRCVEIHEHAKQVEAMTKVKLANTIAKFKICQDALEKTFSERDKSLSVFYKALDKGIESGNQDLILQAMTNISGIVTKSPLSEIKDLCAQFDDEDDDLLDF